MIKKKEISIEAPYSFVCDRCKKEIIYSTEYMELQETYSIKFIGGYSSVFGDGVEVECDLCQECLYDLIKDFYRETNIYTESETK